MRTLALATGKGGTGKTSLAVHLAAGLAREGKRTLLVDLDPTGHATGWLLGLAGAAAGKGTAEVLRDERITEEHVRQVEGRPGLELVPSTRALTNLDLALGAEVGGHAILREVLDGAAGRWDFAILDCPPSLGFFTLSGLCAAEAVLSPVPATPLALAGLRLLEDTAAVARKRLKVGAELLGAVLFAADAREAITAEVRALLEREAPGVLFRSEVRVSTAAKALPVSRGLAWDPGADARGAEDYPAVLRETLARLDGRKLRKVKG